MELISGVFFHGFYLFSIFSICWWVYLAYAHDGAGAYIYLARQKTAPLLAQPVSTLLARHFGQVSIVICFVLFLSALCHGFTLYFSWIPDHYHLVLGDGSRISLATVLSCFVGICSSLVFGKWVFIGICSYWEKRALAEQANLYFDIICRADNVAELSRIRKRTLETIAGLKDRNSLTPAIVSNRLELCLRVIDLRIQDIQQVKK